MTPSDGPHPSDGTAATGPRGTDPPQERRPLAKISTLSRDAGTTAVIATLFLVLRILAISHWNWQTATDVVATVDFGGAASIALGTVFAEPEVTAILIVILGPLTLVTLIWPSKGKSSSPTVPLVFLAGILALMAALIATRGQWWILLGFAIITGVLATVRMLWRRGVAHRTVSRLFRSLGVVSVLGALVMAGTVTTPWVPLEKIETDSGLVYGYVLETPSGYLQVLTEDEREVVIIISSTVDHREVITK